MRNQVILCPIGLLLLLKLRLTRSLIRSTIVYFYRFQSSDLGRALIQSGQVNAFQYGPAGTACLIRSNGLAPDHTQVLWNNISLNSLTLGQADLSLIPMFFLDQIRVSSPSYFTLDANGGIGGAIHLNAEMKHVNRSKFWIVSESSSCAILERCGLSNKTTRPMGVSSLDSGKGFYLQQSQSVSISESLFSPTRMDRAVTE